ATSWSSASRPISRASACAVSATLSSKGALDSVGFSRLTSSRRLSCVLRRSRRSSLSRSSARTRTWRSRIGIGFTIRSSPPASTIFERSGRGSKPVIISTGISAVAGSAFSCLQASCPFMTGISTSIKIRSGMSRRAARTAERVGRWWFFGPERLAEAGFTQFLRTMTPSEAPATPATDSPTESLVRALGEAGLEALRRPEQDAIFEVVGRRLADAGFSTFVFLLADDRGLRCAFRRVTEPDTDFEKVAGQPAVGTIIPFDRAPVLQGVCTSLRPHYIADADELVGRMAVAIPTVAANARRVSELLHMSTMIAAPLVVGDRAIGAIVVVGPRLRQADLPAVMAFANQTAAALEAARLLDESRKTEE